MPNLIRVKDKPRIMLALHHRGKLSLPPLRDSLGAAAFHWSILIVPKTSRGPDCHNLDVTDASIIDPVSRLDLNPSHKWRFRDEEVDVLSLPKLIVLGVLGKLDGQAMADPGEVGRILKELALPETGTGENCVGWTKKGVRKLHRDCIFGRKQMDFDAVFQTMLEEAIRRLDVGDLGQPEQVVNLSDRLCDV